MNGPQRACVLILGRAAPSDAQAFPGLSLCDWAHRVGKAVLTLSPALPTVAQIDAVADNGNRSGTRMSRPAFSGRTRGGDWPAKPKYAVGCLATYQRIDVRRRVSQPRQTTGRRNAERCEPHAKRSQVCHLPRPNMLGANLLDPVADVHTDSFNVRVIQKPTVHDDVS